MRLDIEFLQCIGRRADCPGIRINCIIQNAIHCEIVLLASLAIHRWTDSSSSLFNRECVLLPGFLRGGAWSKKGELSKTSAIQRQVDNLLTLDYLADRCVCRIQRRRR